MPGCFREGFEITCDHSFDPPRAFLADGDRNRITVTERDEWQISDDSYLSYSYPNISYWPVELMDVSVDRSVTRVYGPITSACSTNATNYKLEAQAMTLGRLTEGPLAVSEALNVVVGVGWRVGVTDGSSYTSSPLACRSELPGGHLESARNGSCAGRGCCEAALRQESSRYGPVTEVAPALSLERKNSLWETSPCSYAMVVEKSGYNFSTPDLYGDKALPGRFPRGVPVVLDFAIVGDAACPQKGQRPPPDYACVSNNSYCVNTTIGQSGYALSYVCKCSEHYEGNPYIANGCQGVSKCFDFLKIIIC